MIASPAKQLGERTETAIGSIPHNTENLKRIDARNQTQEFALARQSLSL